MPFYGEDFFNSTAVRAMSADAKLLYLELLWLQWTDGSIPSDQGELAAIVRLTRAAFAKLWARVSKKFRPVEGAPDRLENQRMAEHIARAAQLSADKKERMRLARERRWPPKNGEQITDQITEQITDQKSDSVGHQITVHSSQFTVHSSQNNPTAELQGSADAPPPPTRPPRVRPKVHPNRQAVIAAWDGWFREQAGVPPSWSAKHRGIADRLAHHHALDEIGARLTRLRGLAWLWRDRATGQETMPSIADFEANWDRLAAPVNGQGVLIPALNGHHPERKESVPELLARAERIERERTPAAE